MRYLIMVPPADPQKKIADLKELIACAEERVLTLQARNEPGIARMVHALTNSIRKHRRELQRQLTRQRHTDQADQTNQLVRQKEKMQQAQRDAPTGSNNELPAKQDQEPRKLPSRQGKMAGQ